ncbi:MAG: hypothetical protein M3393_10680, partial [Actinomycetota bacterium]|nr:hypothetical protein [Actinomycetota bacterium]
MKSSPTTENRRSTCEASASQVGKTTLVNQVVHQLGGRFVTLDDNLTRQAAGLIPRGSSTRTGKSLLAIDEV